MGFAQNIIGLTEYTDVYRCTQRPRSLCTSVYRKPTFSGLFMKYDSFVPAQYKLSLVYGLIGRSWKICSSVESFENEVKFLKNILGANGYPY